MIVKSANFVVSNSDYLKCPPPEKPEYAFVGRSNVGKSSLINMLTGNGKLANAVNQSFRDKRRLVSGGPARLRIRTYFQKTAREMEQDDERLPAQPSQPDVRFCARGFTDTAARD